MFDNNNSWHGIFYFSFYNKSLSGRKQSEFKRENNNFVRWVFFLENGFFLAKISNWGPEGKIDSEKCMIISKK